MLTMGMWLQDPDSISSGNSKLLMVFVGMVAVALVTQALAMIAMAIGAAKARKQALAIAEDMRSKIMPVILSTRTMLEDTAPKLKVITDNFAETSHVVRSKAVEFDATMSDVNERVRAQVARVDEMTTSTLMATSNLATKVEQTIRVPVREVAGLVNGLKAGLDVLIGRARGFGRSNGRPRDSDFI
jgi:hypothetical protein